jgi:uncharacterized FAD-dependent dehydrogenase
MAIELSGLVVPLGSKDDEIKGAAAARLGVKPGDILRLRVVRQSLDARRDVRLALTVQISLHDSRRQRILEKRFGSVQVHSEPPISYGSKAAGQPLVVGAGPCGLFAALTLAEHGYKPLLIERGRDVDARVRDVERMRRQGLLDTESNVCFGAGGAGAFSDGKLTTRIKDPRTERVLKTLADCGAPEEILILAKPHTGTENIRTAVAAILERIRALGGMVSYESRLSGITVSNGGLHSVTYSQNGLPQTVETRAAVLSIGHSARDTYTMLLESGVRMEPKPFAVGLRIEHRREFIDKAQYGEAFGHPVLGAAEYRLASRWGSRGVYTFCMCPGGEVICSATEPDGVAVNGMSYYARNGENSNSAVVVAVSPDDFLPGALGGIEFQRQMEQAAYALAGGLGAPVQTMSDFFEGRMTQSFGEVTPSYQPYTVGTNLHMCLPDFVSAALKEGLHDFGNKLKGFDSPDAVLTGVETRTSAPVRVVRDANLQAEGIAGLFPAGEGAGYAGGIVSAAVDGIKCAEALMREFALPA